jgi:uncharacterized membrane protein
MRSECDANSHYWDRWTALLSLAVGCVLIWLSISRLSSYNAGMMDLGNMSQAIWSAGQGQPLEFTHMQGSLSRLAFHVELIYLSLVPIYALFPTAATLLVVQACLFALAGFPLFVLAYRRLQHQWAARLIVLVYLLYPVAQTAVLFDFHGDTLAMPLLIFAFEALDRRAIRLYAVWLLLALACKFYVGVPVAVFGFVLFATGERRIGAWTTGSGVAWFLVALLLIRPHFAPSGYVHPEAVASGYFAVYFGRSLELLAHPTALAQRLLTALIVFGPGFWLGKYALKWLAPAAAVALPALATAGLVAAYDYRFHHYALVVPFIMLAMIEGADHLRRVKNERWLLDVGMQAAIITLCSALLVDMPLNPLFWTSPPGWGRDVWAYGVTSRDSLKTEWLDKNVPDRVPIMASFFLAPHLANRSELFMPQIRDEPGQSDAEHLLQRRLDAVDYVVLDALFDYTEPARVLDSPHSGQGSASRLGPAGGGHPYPVVGGVQYDAEAIRAALDHSSFALIEARDGLLLFERLKTGEGEPLLQQVRVLSLDLLPPVSVSFSDAIGLVHTEFLPLDGRRFRLVFDWGALRSLSSDSPYMAVSRLDGVQDARIVHLPTQVLHPTDMWTKGHLVRESFDIEVPEEVPPGYYPLAVGWYDTGDPYASFTDDRSRLGEEIVVGVLEVPEM